MQTVAIINRSVMYKTTNINNYNNLVFKLNDKFYSTIKLLHPNNLNHRAFYFYRCMETEPHLINKWCRDTNIRRISRIEDMLIKNGARFYNYEIDKITNDLIFMYEKIKKPKSRTRGF